MTSEEHGRHAQRQAEVAEAATRAFRLPRHAP